MNNEELRIEITKKVHELLDNPELLWHRLFTLKPCMLTSLNNQICFQNSLFTLTLNFEPETPLNMNINYSIKDSMTKETKRRSQGRVQDSTFFMTALNELLMDHMGELIFNHQVDWELLTLEELQTLVVPKIRLLKDKIRHFNDTDTLADQLLIESELSDIKEKLTQLADPMARQYAELIDLFET